MSAAESVTFGAAAATATAGFIDGLREVSCCEDC